MRSKLASVGVLAWCVFGVPGSAFGEVGALFLDLTHDGGSDTDIVLFSATGGTIPVEVSFTATGSGTSGSNRGVASVNFDLHTGLPLIDQTPMSLSSAFTNDADASGSSTPGAGFDLFGAGFGNGTPVDIASDGFLDAIVGVGDSQGVNSPQFRKPNGKQGQDLEFAGHFGPIEIATGQIQVAPGTPAGTYVLSVLAAGVGFWDHTPGGSSGAFIVALGDASGTGDTLNLVIVPEPATILLLAPVGLVMMHRRRQGG